ncbi:hypothetical protein [Elizabethkingia anophelis]|uniref:hypothetical protein n=1 Tax=Elizabethkingia anophelis TaxID=1117645 RepID=UPI00301BE022
MKKHLFYPALWGILALSTLSSCRTEDNLNQQNQLADKRFNVFVQTSVGEKIDYANGFAYLMKRGDELYKSNISGINNKTIIGTLASAGKNTSVFQDTEPYVEFKIRSETTTEKNGDKWLVFPKVQGNKVIALVLTYLSKQETKVNYYTYGEQTSWFKENVLVYQNALNKLQKRNVLSLSASIKPMADNGVPCPPNTVPDPTGGCMRLGDIDGVNITVPGPADSGITGPDGGPPPSSGGGWGNYGCEYYNSCYPTPPIPSPDYETEVSPNFKMKLSDQQKYPRFTNMVKNLEQFVRNNPIVLKALIKNTGLTEAKVLEGLKWGKGPEIAIKDFTDNRYGQYTDGTNVLEISAKYVRGLEIVSLPASQKNTSFLLAITILHEYTHFGDYMADGKKEEWEMGWGFEQDILGKARATVEKDNAHIYIKMFNF